MHISYISKKLPKYIFNEFISGPLTSLLSSVTGSCALLGGPWDDKEDLVVVVGALETAVAVGALKTVVVVGALKTAAAPKVEAAASKD